MTAKNKAELELLQPNSILTICSDNRPHTDIEGELCNNGFLLALRLKPMTMDAAAKPVRVDSSVESVTDQFQ